MTMPIIPALAGEPVETPPLQELLAALSDEDVAQLEQEATDYIADAPDPGLDPDLPPDELAETPEDEAAETGEEQAAEDEAGLEGQSPRDMLEAARSAKYDIDDQTSELEQLVAQAEQHEKAGMDMDAITAQLEIAQAAQEEIDALMEAAQDGVDGDDVNATAKAAADARKLAKKVELALMAAKKVIGSSAKAAMDTAIPDDVLAMDAWASKYTVA